MQSTALTKRQCLFSIISSPQTGTQGGYGFVYMQEESAAQSAIVNIHQQVINNVQYSCQLSKQSSGSQNNSSESGQI
jgi:hypothetical protein